MVAHTDSQNVTGNVSQAELDARNAGFWDELCGTALARSLGITEVTPESLRRFDEAYLSFYPYLSRYIDRDRLRGKRVLEIGLGYGTLGQCLAERDCDYHGVDIAPAAVAMMEQRLVWLGRQAQGKVVEGSALALPFPENAFDYVYSIGCLHHTGDLARSVSEVHRVLRPGGSAIVMVYHRYSFRRMVHIPALKVHGFVARRRVGPAGAAYRRRGRHVYDTNEHGDAAPHTDFVSRRDVRRLFAAFRSVNIDVQNFDGVRWRSFEIPREAFLNNLARIAGLDLYITAQK